MASSNFSQKETEGDYFYEESEATDFLIPPIERGRVNLFFVLVFLISLFFLGKVFYLQFPKGSYYKEVAEGNRLRIEKIRANRGLIYDANGKSLVKNRTEFYSVKMPEEKIIDKRIPYEEALKMMTSGSKEVKVRIEPKREYLGGEAFSHLLGFCGKISKEELSSNLGKENYDLTDSIGKDGLELYYEKILKGEDGKQKIEVDPKGNEKKILNEEPAYDGKDITLSLDSDLQKKAEEAFRRYAGKNAKGAVVIMDPRNGQVLSLLSFPTYDNNSLNNEQFWQKLSTDKNSPLINRAIAGLYPSGSIIKPVIALGALEEGLIDNETTVLSTGGIKIGKWFFPDWKPSGHGRVNLVDALSWSINTFFYYIGGGYEGFEGLGPEKINFYLKSVGLGEKTGIDLPNEKAGFVPSKEWKEKTRNEPWYIGDTYNLSIGQGDLLVTPLQVANYTAAIANGGTLFEPSILKDSSKIIKEKIFKKENIDLVKLGLRAVVTRGSAQSLSSLGISVAGKTGTAQVEGASPHAWFTGFAPYPNPQIVITVLIENGGKGSNLAVKITKEILQYYFNLL